MLTHLNSLGLRTEFYWVNTKRVVVIIFRRLGTTYRSHLHSQSTLFRIVKLSDLFEPENPEDKFRKRICFYEYYMSTRRTFICLGLIKAFCKLLREWIFILHNGQQMHNELTNYHTSPTCFDTKVSSSGSS